MIEGQTNGDSPELTVDSAASAFDAILSKEAQESPNAPAPKEPTDNVDEEELVDEVEEPNGDEAPETEPEVVEPPVLRKVKVDGEEIEVTDDELVKGYSRTADYTRKTQKHAEEVKAFASEQTAVREERQKNAELLTRLEEAITSVTPEEPDWDTLRQENPVEFASEWAAWQQYKERLASISEQKNEAIAQVQADQHKAREEYLETERAALVEAIPEWKDETVAKAERDSIVQFARASGYTDADLAEVTDHRVVKLLRMAMLYEKSQKAVPSVRVKIEAVKAATPGSSRTPTARSTQTEKARARLKSSGSVRDAAALFSTMID